MSFGESKEARWFSRAVLCLLFGYVGNLIWWMLLTRLQYLECYMALKQSIPLLTRITLSDEFLWAFIGLNIIVLTLELFIKDRLKVIVLNGLLFILASFVSWFYTYGITLPLFELIKSMK